MRTTIIAGCSGTASLVAGVIAPMVIPPTLPDWVRYGLLGFAAVLYVVTVVAWFSGKKEQDGAAISQGGSGNNQFSGSIHAPVHVGDVHNHVPDHLGIPWPTTSRPFKPRRDTELSEAIAYLLFGEWAQQKGLADWMDNLSDGRDDLLTNVLRDFEQAARDGDIAVWGRDAPYSDLNNWHTTQEPIPPEHWWKHWVDTGSLRSQAKTATRQPWKPDNVRFYDLMVCKAQVHRKWQQVKFRPALRPPTGGVDPA